MTSQFSLGSVFLVGQWMALLVFSSPVRAGETLHGPGEDEDSYVVVRAGRVVTVSGETYAPGLVVIENGKVRLVGRTAEYPKRSEIIDAPGETVMPGLVLARSRHGLPSYSRSGLHGAKKAAEEIFLAEIDFEPLLEAGFTTVGFVPDGSGIPGVASAYRTGGPESTRLLREDAYLCVSMDSPGVHKEGLRRALADARKEIEKVKKAREDWEKKVEQAKKKAEEQKTPPPKKEEPKKGTAEEEKKPTPPKEDAKASPPAQPEKFVPPKIDPNLQPLVDLLEKKPGAGVVFELARASDLLHLDSVLEEYPEVKGPYYLRVGSSSDHRNVAESLGKRKALVLLPPLISELPYTVNRVDPAGDLVRAGCEVAFVPRADSPREYDYFRVRVAALVRCGLERSAALRALTLNPARILGLDDRVGSLEKDREADLIFLSGDPLEPGSRVRRVMIGGKIVWKAQEKKE